ncbi:MAG: ABC transporter ATP-binding protein [Chloroflexi bacterium]|nr:ABC transporter ATP-binding protein [Chloroflexota bacterium]
MVLIDTHSVVKKYGDLLAVAGISFSVETGECFGFLGPNGAGKTTIMKLMCCTSPITQGEICIGGKNVTREPRSIKATIGVVPQEENLDPDLTVLENLLVYSRYFDIPKALAMERSLESLKLFQLTDKKDDFIRTLSGGMKRRLLVARALLNQPKILMLDEPTTGLDPQARHLVWHTSRHLKTSGTTIILSTNNMEEAAFLCDRLVIMYQGSILAEGHPQELVTRYVGQRIVELRPSPEKKQGLLQQLKSMSMSAEDAGDTLYLFGEDGERIKGYPDLEEHNPVQRPANLEDVFLKLTGRGLTE